MDFTGSALTESSFFDIMYLAKNTRPAMHGGFYIKGKYEF